MQGLLCLSICGTENFLWDRLLAPGISSPAIEEWWRRGRLVRNKHTGVQLPALGDPKFPELSGSTVGATTVLAQALPEGAVADVGLAGGGDRRRLGERPEWAVLMGGEPVEMASVIRAVSGFQRFSAMFAYPHYVDLLFRDFVYIFGNSGFVVGERGFGPATALDTVDAPILKPSAFGRGWDLGACVNGGVEGRAGDAPLPPKWLITMGLRQKNRFNECKACGCEPASNHMSGFGFSATDSDSGRRAHGSHERARSARKGRKKHVSVLPRPNRSPWIVVEQNHNGIGKLMVPAFQIYANMNVINDL